MPFMYAERKTSDCSANRFFSCYLARITCTLKMHRKLLMKIIIRK